jgi:hypothetical protein
MAAQDARHRDAGWRRKRTLNRRRRVNRQRGEVFKFQRRDYPAEPQLELQLVNLQKGYGQGD